MAEKNDLDASNNANKDISTLKKGEGNHEDKDEEMQGCGWFNFRPSCLRFCSSPRYLLVLLCAYFFANGAVVTGIFSTSISTIEKRFSLSRYIYIYIVWYILKHKTKGEGSYYSTGLSHCHVLCSNNTVRDGKLCHCFALKGRLASISLALEGFRTNFEQL